MNAFIWILAIYVLLAAIDGFALPGYQFNPVRLFRRDGESNYVRVQVSDLKVFATSTVDKTARTSQLSVL
jgi:hypothetical protein